MKHEPISVELSTREMSTEEIHNFPEPMQIREAMLKFHYWNGKEWCERTLTSNIPFRSPDKHQDAMLVKNVWRGMFRIIEAGRIDVIDDADNKTSEDKLLMISRHPAEFVEVKLCSSCQRRLSE